MLTTATISRAQVQAALAESAKRVSAKLERTSFTWFKWAAVVGLSASATLFTVHHFKSAQPVVKLEAPSHLRSVSLAQPKFDSRQHELLLPAEVRANQTTAINARIAGYLKAWHVDRGTRVSAGQVLAEIDAPEFDQELLRAQSELEEGRTALVQTQAERDQARANASVARANIQKAEAILDLAAKTAERYKDLEEKWAATRQQYDEAVRNKDAAQADLAAAQAGAISASATVATREASIRTAQAHINSLEASLHRLKELEAFKTIVAPYAGLVTQRNVDVGALISTDGAHPLFTLTQDHLLRVAVNVPQTYAGLVKLGQNADVLAREFSAAGLKARVARTSGTLDPSARTLAVELELPNAAHVVFPGAFVQVRFLVQDDQPAVLIPTNTLRFSADGTQVFSVDENQRLQVLPVKLGRDFGAQVEVLSGLTGRPGLVVNPSDNMTSGEQVQVEGAAPVKLAAN